MIKVCPDPHCEAVYHFAEKQDRYCLDCGGTIKKINESTYFKKFANNWFQYDYRTGDVWRLSQQNEDLILFN